MGLEDLTFRYTPVIVNSRGIGPLFKTRLRYFPFNVIKAIMTK